MAKKKGVNKIPMIRKKEEKKIKVRFEFEDELGVKYTNNGEGRIKISAFGDLNFLVKKEAKWIGIKGRLIFLKPIKVPKLKRA